MTNKISALATTLRDQLPSLPDLSLEKVSAAALKELPWVAGGVFCGAAITLNWPIEIPAILLSSMGVTTFGAYYLDSNLPLAEKVEKLTLIFKIEVMAMSILLLGIGGYCCSEAVLLLQEMSALSLPASLLFKGGSILTNLYLGRKFLQQGLSLKSFSQNIGQEWKDLIASFAEGWKRSQYEKVWASLDKMGLNHLIQPLQLCSPYAVADFMRYLEDNPEDIDKAVSLFPHLFKTPPRFGLLSRLIDRMSYPDFNNIEASTTSKFSTTFLTQDIALIDVNAADKPLPSPLPVSEKADNESHKIKQHPAKDALTTYVIQKFSSQFPEEEFVAWLNNNPTFEKLHDYITQIKQLNTKFAAVNKAALNKITLKGSPFGRSLLEAQEKLKSTHARIASLSDRFKTVRTQLVETHLKSFKDYRSLDKIFDEVGFTQGDYYKLSKKTSQSDFSSRLKVVHELNDRGIYCQDDLNKLIGYTDKANLVQRIADFLDGKTLEPVEQKPATTHSKMLHISAVVFNVAFTAATLKLQMSAAPVLTGLGVAYGFLFQQKALSFFSSYRFFQTSLFFPQPLAQKCTRIAKGLFMALTAFDTKTKVGQFFAFSAGVSQGEILRDYLNQAL